MIAKQELAIHANELHYQVSRSLYPSGFLFRHSWFIDLCKKPHYDWLNTFWNHENIWLTFQCKISWQLLHDNRHIFIEYLGEWRTMSDVCVYFINHINPGILLSCRWEIRFFLFVVFNRSSRAQQNRRSSRPWPMFNMFMYITNIIPSAFFI